MDEVNRNIFRQKSQYYMRVYRSFNECSAPLLCGTLLENRIRSPSPISSTIPERNGAAVIYGLLYLHNHQVRRNRPGATCQRRNCQSCGSSFRIPYCQGRIDYGCFHNRHPHNLGASCCATCYRIWQVFPVQGQHQLSSFRHTHLEQHLVGADFRQIEGAGAGTGNAGTTVGTILWETDICTGCYRCRVVRRHYRIEICIA